MITIGQRLRVDYKIEGLSTYRSSMILDRRKTPGTSENEFLVMTTDLPTFYGIAKIESDRLTARTGVIAPWGEDKVRRYLGF